VSSRKPRASSPTETEATTEVGSKTDETTSGSSPTKPTAQVSTLRHGVALDGVPFNIYTVACSCFKYSITNHCSVSYSIVVNATQRL